MKLPPGILPRSLLHQPILASNLSISAPTTVDCPGPPPPRANRTRPNFFRWGSRLLSTYPGKHGSIKDRSSHWSRGGTPSLRNRNRRGGPHCPYLRTALSKLRLHGIQAYNLARLVTPFGSDFSNRARYLRFYPVVAGPQNQSRVQQQPTKASSGSTRTAMTSAQCSATDCPNRPT